MRLALVVAAAALLSVGLAAHADTLNDDLTYAGSSSAGLPGISAKGSGSFTVSYAPGQSMGRLTAFSFSDRIGTDTFTYDLSDISSGRINLSRGNSPTIESVNITTAALLGSEPIFGAVLFELQDSAGAIYESTKGRNSTLFDTKGGGALSSSLATTPEPSSIALLGTGLLAVAAVLRKRLSA